jgi:hypothetical protein
MPRFRRRRNLRSLALADILADDSGKYARIGH